MLRHKWIKYSDKLGQNNPWLDFLLIYSQVAKNVLELSTMAGENFDTYVTQISKTHFKLSTMVGNFFEIHLA